MPNVIVVTEQELQDLIQSAQKCDGLSRRESVYWDGKLKESKEPNFLGYSEDGMCLYEIRFGL
jgi:hypothetical protein